MARVGKVTFAKNCKWLALLRLVKVKDLYHVVSDWVFSLVSLHADRNVSIYRKQTIRKVGNNHVCNNVRYNEYRRHWISYLKINMKSIKRAKNTATLSIVRSMTTNWRLKFGKNLTNLRILKSLKVLNTEIPLPSIVIPWKIPL